MFVGHYGPIFATKALNRSIPLWVLFIAVQLLDIVWSIFVLLGVEGVRIVPGITGTNPFDFYYGPYSHSLIGAMIWSIAASIVYHFFRTGDGWGTAAFVGGAVLSHWPLDWLVHRPDLPLYDNSLKTGLGLWNHPTLAFSLEIAVLFGGMLLYLKTTKWMRTAGRYVFFGFFMVVVQSIVFFGHSPCSERATAITALASYIFFVGVAYFLETEPSTSQSSTPASLADT